MVCSIIGNVKPGLSALENEAADARAVMHLVNSRGEEVTLEQSSALCPVDLGLETSSAPLALQPMAWPPCVIRY